MRGSPRVDIGLHLIKGEKRIILNQSQHSDLDSVQTHRKDWRTRRIVKKNSNVPSGLSLEQTRQSIEIKKLWRLSDRFSRTLKGFSFSRSQHEIPGQGLQSRTTQRLHLGQDLSLPRDSGQVAEALIQESLARGESFATIGVDSSHAELCLCQEEPTGSPGSDIRNWGEARDAGGTEAKEEKEAEGRRSEECDAGREQNY